MNLGDAIRKIAESGEEVYAKVCKVTSIDTDERTCECEPLDGTADIPAVRLQADTEGSAGFLIMPKVGSFVVVNFLNADAAFVALTYDIDYVHLFGDQYGGLIKVEELKSQLAKNTARIDAILNILKTTITSVSLHPNSLWSTIITPIVDALQKENYSNIENGNVKHG